jgi:hypothetical protein
MFSHPELSYVVMVAYTSQRPLIPDQHERAVMLARLLVPIVTW